jgi:hypothetical protein
VCASTAEASSANGAVRTVTPRPAWTAKGNTAEVNSMSGTSTVVPSRSAAAIGPRSWETAAPVLTCSAPMPTSRPNSSLEVSTLAAQPCQLVRPACHSSSEVCSAPHAGRGGGP